MKRKTQNWVFVVFAFVVGLSMFALEQHLTELDLDAQENFNASMCPNSCGGLDQ